jgi:hypothetical protein
MKILQKMCGVEFPKMTIKNKNDLKKYFIIIIT